MAISIQTEVDATVDTMKKTRLRIARLIEQAYAEAASDETPLEIRLRVLSVLTKALKDLGTNIGQLRNVIPIAPTTTNKETLDELFKS